MSGGQRKRKHGDDVKRPYHPKHSPTDTAIHAARKARAAAAAVMKDDDEVQIVERPTVAAAAAAAGSGGGDAPEKKQRLAPVFDQARTSVLRIQYNALHAYIRISRSEEDNVRAEASGMLSEALANCPQSECFPGGFYQKNIRSMCYGQTVDKSLTRDVFEYLFMALGRGAWHEDENVRKLSIAVLLGYGGLVHFNELFRTNAVAQLCTRAAGRFPIRALLDVLRSTGIRHPWHESPFDRAFIRIVDVLRVGHEVQIEAEIAKVSDGDLNAMLPYFDQQLYFRDYDVHKRVQRTRDAWTNHPDMFTAHLLCARSSWDGFECTVWRYRWARLPQLVFQYARVCRNVLLWGEGLQIDGKAFGQIVLSYCPLDVGVLPADASWTDRRMHTTTMHERFRFAARIVTALINDKCVRDDVQLKLLFGWHL